MSRPHGKRGAPQSPEQGPIPASARPARMTKRRLGPLSARRLRSAFLLSGVLPACAIATRPVSAQQTAAEVESIRVEGVNSLDAAIIRRSIKTRASRCRSPLFLIPCRVGDWSWAETKVTIDTMEARRDVERIKLLYEAWGFPDARVDGEIIPQSDGDVVVRFRVTEGEPIVIREIVVRGTDSIPGFELPAHLPLRVGEPYALPRLEDTQDVLRTLLAQHGYPLSEIEVSGDLNATARSATLVLDVKPGRLVRFGETRFRVEPPIDENVARNRVAYKSGEPFSINAIERTERSLYALPIVERAMAEPTRTPAADSIVDVVVSVEARRASGFSGEALLSSTDCGELRGFWQHRYFLGGPRVFALGVSASNLFAEQADGDFPCTSAGTGTYGKPELGVEADLRQFIGSDHMLLLRAFADRESSPGVYVERGFGGELAFAHSVSPTMNVMLGISPQRSRLNAAAVYYCGQYGVCAADAIEPLTQSRWLSPIELTGAWLSTTAPPDIRRPNNEPGRDWAPELIPRNRADLRASLTAAGAYSGSDYEYERALAELRAHRSVSQKFELAGRVRAGWLHGDGILPPQVMLFSGGANTVRGHAQSLLGPKVLLTTDTATVCIGSCLTGVIDPESVVLRPTGGERVLEGNLEGRFWVGSRLQLAAFLDAGRVSGRNPNGLSTMSQTSITPGIGLRVIADVGPIRLDLGYDPSGPKQYPLFVEQSTGDLRLVRTVRYDPYTFDRPGFFKETFRRLQIHLAIGQAF